MRLENGHYAPRTAGAHVIPNRNYLQARLIWDQLVLAGVARVVISPGSRSTPLARTAAMHDRLQVHVLTDERVAGFFALGLCKGAQEPVALLCTSGTASAHYYPAVIEAAQSGYPLIVVSADRPKRLRHHGAAQTIDQLALFGRYAKMALDLPEAVSAAGPYRRMLAMLGRGLCAMNTAPLGPLHINVPTDEPLAPDAADPALHTALYEELRRELAPLKLHVPQQRPELTAISTALESAFCGLVVCGPDAARNEAEREAIHTLARKLGWPLLADVASGLRDCGEPNLPGYDLFLRHAELARLAPDFVLEFGSPPTSKALITYLNAHRARTVRVQRDTLPRDPEGRAAEVLVTDVASCCAALTARVKVSRDSLLLDPFWRVAGAARAAMSALSTFPQAELAYVAAALDTLPVDGNLVLASSMPVRYADMLTVPTGKRLHVFAQRGTNGIDGALAHAAGIAQATARPTLLICGDLAFLHDLGGWMAARPQPNLRVLLLNNNGGGIFHFLPVAAHADTFEQLHGTPLNIELSAAGDLFAIQWYRCGAPHEISTHLQWAYPHAAVLEARTQRDSNHAAHEQFVQTVLQALH